MDRAVEGGTGIMRSTEMRRIILGSLIVALLAAGVFVLHLPSWEEPEGFIALAGESGHALLARYGQAPRPPAIWRRCRRDRPREAVIGREAGQDRLWGLDRSAGMLDPAGPRACLEIAGTGGKPETCR